MKDIIIIENVPYKTVQETIVIEKDKNKECCTGTTSKGDIIEQNASHNNLKGLQGGTEIERYHISKRLYDALQNINASNLNRFITVQEVNALLGDIDLTELKAYIDQKDFNLQTAINILENNIGTLETSINAHKNRTDNPHNVTKVQIGLNNVDNTPDSSKPISVLQAAALDDKVDKVNGKGLSSNDFTSAEKQKLANLTDVPDVSGLATKNELTAEINRATIAENLKVSKVTGKDLSANDYTDIDKARLADTSGINTGDQDLSSYITDIDLNTAISNLKPTVVQKNISSSSGETSFVYNDLIGKEITQITRFVPLRLVSYSTGLSSLDVYFNSTNGNLIFGSPFSDYSELVSIVTYGDYVPPVDNNNKLPYTLPFTLLS